MLVTETLFVQICILGMLKRGLVCTLSFDTRNAIRSLSMRLTSLTVPNLIVCQPHVYGYYPATLTPKTCPHLWGAQPAVPPLFYQGSSDLIPGLIFPSKMVLAADESLLHAFHPRWTKFLLLVLRLDSLATHAR